MHNNYPAQTSPEAQQPLRNPEEAYRQELTANILEASVGTVGLYSSMDLVPEDKAAMQQSFAERNPGTPPAESNQSFDGRTGWGNYGERPIALADIDPLNSASKTIMGQRERNRTAEELHFIDLPDGNVDVRYGFTSPDFLDGSGRPGNVLLVGFVLPKEGAKAMLEASQADPSFVREVVQAQAKALGVTERQWTQRLAPRGEDPKAHELRLVGHDPTTGSEAHTEAVDYAKRGRIAPVRAQRVEAAPVPYAEQATVAMEAKEDQTVLAARHDAQEIVEMLQDDPEGTLLNLTDAAWEHMQVVPGAEITEGMPVGATERVYHDAYRAKLQELAVEDEGAAVFDYQDKLLADFNKLAVESGYTPDLVGDLTSVVNRQYPPRLRHAAYQLMVFNDAFHKLVI